MAISEVEVEILANTLARDLVDDDVVDDIDPKELARRIARILEADRDLELEINEEAKKLMQAHAAEISREGMDTGMLFRKFRQQIAQKKGFPL